MATPRPADFIALEWRFLADGLPCYHRDGTSARARSEARDYLDSAESFNRFAERCKRSWGEPRVAVGGSSHSWMRHAYRIAFLVTEYSTFIIPK